MRRDEDLIARVHAAVLQGCTTVDGVLLALNLPLVASVAAQDMNRQRVLWALDALEGDGLITWPRSPNGQRIEGGVRVNP